jgi:hypothetical protein
LFHLVSLLNSSLEAVQLTEKTEATGKAKTASEEAKASSQADPRFPFPLSARPFVSLVSRILRSTSSYTHSPSKLTVRLRKLGDLLREGADVLVERLVWKRE